MFESIVATVLNQVLGNYVDNMEKNQLNLGIFSGNVVLKNLKLKKEAVDKLNLPIEIFEGYLGSLELRIPWANLKNQPVRVLIEDLFVLAGPLTETEYDPLLEEQRIQKAKQEMLETAELFRSSKTAEATDETFVNSLVSKIVDNLQIVIKNIHVRFEDQNSHSSAPFSLGLTLSNLSAVSTDGNWNEAFIDDPTKPTHKLAKLDSLAMYWTPKSSSLRGLPADQFIASFKNLIHSEHNQDLNLRYLLKPVSGFGKIIMKKKLELGAAKNIVNLEFESFRVKIDNEQYYDVLMLAQYFIMSARNLKYRKYRPKLTASPAVDPLAWFKYAGTCVLEKIKARNKKRLWLTVIKRRQARKKYVLLFKKKEVDGSLAADEEAHFKILEEMLSLEDIKFYRSIARSEMREENLIPFALKQQQKPKGFLSRWWYSSSSAESDALIKDEDIKKFYETIDYDANAKNAAIQEPADAKLLELNFDLKSGSIALAQTIDDQSRRTILSLQFVDLIAHIIKRPETLRAEISLLDLSILENLTKHSIFPNLVRAKNSNEKFVVEKQVTQVQDEQEEIDRLAKNASGPFLKFVMDELTDNPNAEKSIFFSMKPLEIVLNHQAFHKILDFVYGPRERAALSTLASAAENQITHLANKTRANLEMALDNHKAIDLYVNIDAPIIYIPYDCEDESSFLFIADLGHIDVKSQLVTTEQKQEFAKKRRHRLTVAEQNALYNLMYDVLNIDLKKIKVTYAASLREWQTVNLDPEFIPESNRLIDDIDVKLSVATCIVPRAINLAQTRIHGRVPAVQLMFSDEKYKRLMELLEVITPPKTGEEHEEAAVPVSDHPIFSEGGTSTVTSLSPQLDESAATVKTETTDEFFDAIDAESTFAKKSDDKAEYEAVKLDFVLEIEEVVTKLRRENKKYRRKDLLTLVAKKLFVAANVQPFNTIVNLGLESFFIRDDLNFGLDGMNEVYLLSGLAGSDEKSLLKVNVNLVDSAHPLFSTQYNSAAIQTVIELAALKLFINPYTIIQAAEFFDTMFDKDDFEESLPEPSNELRKSKSLASKPKRTLSKHSAITSQSDGVLLKRKSITGEDAAEVKPLKPKKPEPKILLNAKLSEFSVILGIGSGHFADIVLQTAAANVCVDRGDVAFNGRIADLSILHKRRPFNAPDFAFLKIDGDSVLDVSFNTFASVSSNPLLYPGFDQLVKLTSGALHFTYDALFIEDLCRFAVGFAEEAQVLERKKREKERRSRKRAKSGLKEVTFADEDTIEEEEPADVKPAKLQFEVDIRSPVFDLPNPVNLSEKLSIFLGHIHANNSFVLATDKSGNPLMSFAGQLVDQFINAKVESMCIVMCGADGQEFKLLDDITCSTKVSLVAQAVDRDYAETDVEGKIDVVRLKVAKSQLQQVMVLANNLSGSLRRATAPLERMKEFEKKSAKKKPVPKPAPPEGFVVDEHNPMPTAVEVDFGIGAVELIVYEDWEVRAIARFALEDLGTWLILQKDQSIIFEQYIASICASDLRTSVQRKFKDIITPGSTDESEDIQFKFERTASGDQIIKVKVDAPQIVLSMDFVNAILAVVEGLNPPKEAEDAMLAEPEMDPLQLANREKRMAMLVNDLENVQLSETSLPSVTSLESGSSFTSAASAGSSIEAEPVVKTFILAEVMGMNLFVLEDPDSVSSEAIQLSVKNITFAQQGNMSLSVDGIAAAFVNMDSPASQVQFIDPFDISATVELSSTKAEKATQVWVAIQPIILRFSYQDIQFFSKISEQFSKKPAVQSEVTQVNQEQVDDPVTLSNVSSPMPSESTLLQPSIPASVTKIIEQVQVNLEGITAVFIDDFSNVHIPLLEVSVDRVAAHVQDWSSALKVNGVLKLHANFFNRLNSHWEPVLEPWSLDLSLLTQKNGSGKSFSDIVVSSEKSLDVIASHALLESLLSVSGKMANAEPRAASAYREVSKPYLIHNFTGCRLSLWCDSRVAQDGQPEVFEMNVNSELPFEFEDWKTSRKGVTSKVHSLSIHLMDSTWESVKGINVDKKGVFVFPLRPKVNSVSHKLVCEVELVEGIRHIILRSATCFRNDTEFDLEVQDVAAERFSDTIKIRSGGIASLPIVFSAGGAFKVRPLGMDCDWSIQKYDLHDLFPAERSNKRVSKTVQCNSLTEAIPFFLSLKATSDTPEEVIFATSTLAAKAATKKDRLSFYGLGTIRFCAPLVLENLLPYDFKYRIYDRESQYDFSASLEQGQLSPIHGVDTGHTIGISIDIAAQGLKTKQVAVISNAPGRSIDKKIVMVDESGLEVSLFISVERNKMGARKIQIYSPYVIINQTGQVLEFKSSTAFIGSSQPAAGLKSSTAETPLLFSYPESSFVSGKDRIKIKAQDTDWSKPLSLDAVGNVSNFDLQQSDSGKYFNYALYGHLGADRFANVHVVKISPRFMLANRLGSHKLFVKAGNDLVLELEAASSQPLHCNPNCFKSISLSFDNVNWTPSFAIGDVMETFLKVYSEDGSCELLKVTSALNSHVMNISVNPERKWPFRMQNSSSIPVAFSQKGFNPAHILAPGETVDFAWEDPSASLALTVTVGQRTRELNIRELGPSKPITYRFPGGEKAAVIVDVLADGPVFLVQFRDYSKSSRRSRKFFSFGKSQSQEAELEDDGSVASLELPQNESDSVLTTASSAPEIKDDTEMSFTLKLAGFGISLVGADLVEFLFVYGRDLEFRLVQSQLYQTLGFKLHWLQIDNCLLDYTYPILCYPAVIKRTAQDLSEHPTINLGIIKSRDTSHGVDYYKYFGLLMQELNLDLGEELLRKLLLFAQFESIIPPPKPLLCEEDFKVPELEAGAADARMMYYDLFQIHPVKLNITFARIEADNSGDSGIAAYNPLGPLMSVLSMATANISDAPLKFNSLLLEHPLVNAETLKNRVIGHYTQQAIVQVHKILGSIDMLGNPVGLFNTMGEGVTDLFYEPYQGFVSDRPQDIGIGLAKGGFSFMRKTVAGLTGTFSKFTGSLGKGLAAATMDTSFQRARRTTQARNRPLNAAEGVTTGAKSFYQGFASGLQGIVEKPMEGARQSGVGGFFKGVGVGLLGAVTKPIVGVVDLTTSITEGVKGSADGEEDEISQIRWPRVIPHDSIIQAYSAREAYGQSLLASCIGLDLSHERYYAHLEVPEDECIVFLTTLRVLYVKRRTLFINWQVPYDEVLFARPNFDSILLSLRHGDIRKRIIFCQDAASQEWFCMQVDAAMAIYSEKHRSIE